MSLNFSGVIIGVLTFFLIGVFHPIVIKCEYHFGTKPWPLFLILGIGFSVLSLFITNVVVSSIISVLGIVLLWSIRELFEQKERVKKGWFPKKEDQ